MRNPDLLIEIHSELRNCLDKFCLEIQEDINLCYEKYQICSFQVGEGMSFNEAPYSLKIQEDELNQNLLVSIIFNVYVQFQEENQTILSLLDQLICQKVDQLIIEWIENTELSRFSIQNKYTNQSGEAFKHTSTYSRKLTCNYIISTIA